MRSRRRASEAEMEATDARPCPVCGGADARPLYRQRFARLSGGNPVSGYDVVVCEACGAGFARGIPSQAELDAYYRDLSKYENAERGGGASPADAARFEAIARSLAPFVPSSEAAVLDVGCATGGLLAEIRRLGFARVEGLDPSPACAESARSLHGLEVRTGSLAALPDGMPAYDLVILLGVLEHLRDVGPALASVRRLLPERGRLFVEVPDVAGFARYLEAPFQQFSVEHVSFFSETSLGNVLRRHGFEPLVGTRGARAQSESSTMPVLTTVAEKVAAPAGRMVRDGETLPALEAYIERSEAREAPVAQVIDDLVRSRRPVVVWGVGTQTAHLLTTRRLAEACIVAFVDSNPGYQGRTLGGVPVFPPEFLRTRSEAVVISTGVYHREILRQLREGLGCPNDVIVLNAETPRQGLE